MQEILKAQERWQEALSSGDENNITKLYHPDAVLWGTLSPDLRNTPELIGGYFKRFATLHDIKVEFGDHDIRELDKVAVNTGYYTFSWKEDGKEITVPARYSFVYVHEDEWLIIDHHSSVIPETPFDPSKYISSK